MKRCWGQPGFIFTSSLNSKNSAEVPRKAPTLHQISYPNTILIPAQTPKHKQTHTQTHSKLYCLWQLFETTDASKVSKHQAYLTFMTDKSGNIPRASRLLVFRSHNSQLHQHAAAVHCILNSHFLDQMLQVSVINNITQEHAVKSRPHEHSAVAGIIG